MALPSRHLSFPAARRDKPNLGTLQATGDPHACEGTVNREGPWHPLCFFVDLHLPGRKRLLSSLFLFYFQALLLKRCKTVAKVNEKKKTAFFVFDFLRRPRLRKRDMLLASYSRRNRCLSGMTGLIETEIHQRVNTE